MPAVTLQQLRSRVLSRLDDNTALYPASETNAMINEYLRILSCFTGILQTTVSVPTLSVSNRVWYDTPSPIIIPMRVQFEGRYLQKMFPNQIGKAYPTWTQDTTTSTGLPVSEWVPCGFNSFAIHPADSIGGGDISVTGIQEVSLLVNDTDTVTIPNEFTDALVLGAASTLQLKETPALFKQGAPVITQYYSILKKIQIWRGFQQPRFWIPELVQDK